MYTLHDDIKQRQFDRYEVAFNFFLSKPIDQLINGRRLPHVINFVDIESFLKNDEQFLKRFYQLPQIEPRILRLTEFYQQSLPPPQPHFLTYRQHQIFFKRLRRINKIKRRREEQQNQSHCLKHSFMLQQMEQLSIDDIDNQNSIISQLANIKSSIAVEGQLHNIYNDQSESEAPDQVKYDPKQLMSLDISEGLIMDFGTRKQHTRPKVVKQASRKENVVHPASFMQYYYSLGQHKPTLIGQIYGEMKFNQRM